MEIPTTNQQSEIIARYKKMRPMGIRLIHKVVETLDRDAIQTAGRELGMMKKGTLVFESEDESSVLMDFALHHVRQNKRTALERYLSDTPPRESEELAWLKAVQAARYRILRIDEVLPGFGVQVHDVLRDEGNMLVDLNFSRSSQPGLILVGNIFLFENYWATTGAALPAAEETAKILLAEVTRRFGKQPHNYRNLSALRESELATMTIRICLQSGMGTRIRYADG